MASELEGLIAGLLVHISCHGEEGCPVDGVLKAIHHPSTQTESLSEGDSAVQARTAATIWSWLTARRDISVGADREYNHLTLDQVLALPIAGGTPGQNAEPTEPLRGNPTEHHHVRVYASEDTMWESLTGHAVDYKRVPKSEWMLLLGIASTTTQGILQGDLGRLTDQDKRSVPKRTDSLLKKGYIVKRTTLVRGTKTSKMWLKLFAPPLPKDGEGVDEARPDMTLTRQVLVEDLEPVPWRVRWTGESIDYIALATTIMAIVKEWGVLQMKDMKSKLGVLGMRWQMKVLAKVCRFLNQRGVIQYVAAKLGEKVFKDCVKYVRDLNAEDWSLYLSTGKRKSKTPRNPDLDGYDGNKQLIGQASNVSEVSKSPPWSLDKPIPVIIAEMAKRLGDVGLTNPDVYALTLGPSYSRHLSSMTTALAVPGLQPPHLAHFQIYSEHTRTGKVASYRYFAPNAPHTPSPPSTDAAGQESTPTPADIYGFSSLPSSSISHENSPTLAELCSMGMTNRKTVGRPKASKAKKGKPAPTPKAKRGRKRRAPTPEISPQEEVGQEDEATEEVVIPQIPETIVQEPELPTETPAPELLAPSEINEDQRDDAVPEPQKAATLVVTLKVSPAALKELLAKAQTDVATPARPTRTRPTRSSARKVQTRTINTDAENEEISNRMDVDDELELNNSTESLLTGRKRGRPKKGEDRPKGNAEQATENDNSPRPWVCEKCGRAWKNDNGLLYHVTKSRTNCNPSFDVSTVTPTRRGKKESVIEVGDQDTATPVVDKPQEQDRRAVDDEEREEPQDKDKDHNNNENTGREIDNDEGEKDGKARGEGKEPSPDDEDVPMPKPVSRTRGPIAARPTWSSRPTLSFKGEAFQVNPELQRPPVTMFDSPKQPSLINGTNGALVQGENSQLRPVLSSLDRFSLVGASPKTPRSKLQRNGSQPDATPQPEQYQPIQHSTNGTPSGPGSVVKPKTPMVTDTPITKAVINNRVSQIIQNILAEHQGVFPGGKSLWTAISIRWVEAFPEVVPQIRSYQAAFRELLKHKIVAEHWLTFRSKKGVTEKCHLVVTAGVDPFSPEASDVAQKIQEAHPDLYLPPPFDAQLDSDLLKRGRRDLPEEVEMLDAPVYVARAAQKRALDEYDDDGDDFPPPAKRGRKRKSMFADGRPSRSRAWQGDMGEPMCYEHFESSQGAPEALQFLDPNTCLEEDGIEGSERYFTDDFRTILEQRLSNPFSGEIVFDKPIIVSGYDGVWPRITPQDFEMQDASYTLTGWMPDPNWFAWSSMIDMIDRKAHLLNRDKLQRQDVLDPYRCFIERLYCCMDLERAWSESFINAPPGAAGPHNIFISFSSERDDQVLETPAPEFSWPLDWQLTPKSFQGDVPDRALLVDASSDEEDDSTDWPEFPAYRQQKLARGAGRQSRGRGVGRGSVSRPRASISRQQLAQQPRVKRVRLVTRALMPIPEEAEQRQQGQHDQQGPSSVDSDSERLLAALIAVRVLLGGADKSVDWGLLLKLFPNLALKDIRRFWIDARREQGAYVRKLTKDFQDRFIVAYSKNELPEFDFEDPMDYDWDNLIEWTLELPRRKGVDLPSTRHYFEDNFSTSAAATHEEEDPREKFYNPQSSVYARFEAVTFPAYVTVDKMLSGLNQKVKITNEVIARSWVRSLCCTDESRYTVDQIQQKFGTLADGDQDQINAILKEAIDVLTAQRIICKSKRPPLSGRPFRLNEAFGHVLGKLAQRTKYQDAADFKSKLDATFRRGEAFRVPFNLQDGAVMALTNLNAGGRIKLTPVNVPHIPLGFRPGYYEMRKLKKDCYFWNIEATPTDSYKYDKDVGVIRKSINEGPPTAKHLLPQWVDFFGRRDAERWMDVLGAFCFVYANRGHLTIEGVCNALKPILEEFEAELIMDWGMKTGVLEEDEDGLGLRVGEWWWLAVPWQWGRQPKARREVED
ncbi:hypothetical protein FOPG_06462 [Fusarium oxysporum f. sp. conglutinans race 2 54008]|uniref:C2H2-type domain-containing protein n=1 Tax=Fusarium oxysporum f. sp. conglutinans race 2 54008 TaxID=1089457 RepID=X0I6U5_FUSOX|nr:hypothetical protein FOPG_06462 [Fusarium oxysporum f. sp. conglutinans race 2 54008]KAG6981913.1 hypothetical protein FocnCong_v009077 [Fusarium oxysporum f. sp. conglutinans]